jgi:hypothetical protein
LAGKRKPVVTAATRRKGNFMKLIDDTTIKRTIFRRFVRSLRPQTHTCHCVAVLNIVLFKNVFVMAKLEDRLKEAIVRMPVKEKDKLLLRLAAKDKKLIRQLEFELLEGGATRDDRATALKRDIGEDLLKSARDITSPGWLLVFMRHWSGRITEHVQATKDRPGEVALTAYLMAESFRVYRGMLDSFPGHRSDTFAPYIVRRTNTIIPKALKLHEDYFIEFRRDMKDLLHHIWTFPPTELYAKSMGLPREWDL